MVKIPRTDGAPETGTFGVGAAAITVGAGVAVTIIGFAVTTIGADVGVAVTTIGADVGFAVTTTTTGLEVGIGVAVAVGQTQVNWSIHSGFLQRLMPCTVAQTNSLEQSPSPPQEASQTPGTEGGDVGVGVSV